MTKSPLEKILKDSELNGLIELLRANNNTIAFTNGCFDILHPGHVDYLAKAKKEGDVLIVAVNSDASVQVLKGRDRPINNLRDRMMMLAALESVDFVVSFEESTPLKLIQRIQPDLLIKGGDYKVTEIVGYDSVTQNGGKVMTIPFLEAYSSSSIIEKIKASSR